MNYIFFPSGLRLNLRLAEVLAEEHKVFPVAWLGDERLHSEAASNFPESRMLGASELMAPYGEENFGVESNRTLLRYWNCDYYRSKSQFVLAEFDRSQYFEHVRQIDRNILRRRIEARIYAVTLQCNPSFALFSESPHNVVQLSAFYMFKWLQIPTLFFQATNNLTPALLPRTDLDQIFYVPPQLRLHWQSLSPFLVETAIESLKFFESGLSTRYEQLADRAKPVRRRSLDFLHGLKNKSVSKINELRLKRFRPTGFLYGDLLANLLNRFFRARLLRTYSKLPSNPASRKFVLFTLQVEKERTVVPEGSNRTESQIEMILLARELVPPEIPLVIKEHRTQMVPVMKGERGRSPWSYTFLDSVEGIEVIGGSVPLRDLLADALCVMTVTGSAGLEAAVNGIPCVYFGEPWWAGAPGTTKFDSSLNFKQLLRQASQVPGDIFTHIHSRIEDACIPGYGTPGSKRAVHEQLALPDGFEQISATALTRVVGHFASSIRESHDRERPD